MTTSKSEPMTGIKFIKVTDTSSPLGAQFGYHTVDVTPTLDPQGQPKPWVFPGDPQSFEFVDEAEVRKNAPQVLQSAPEE